MSVRRILERKGRDVVTLAPDATLAEVAKVLSEKRIGAIVLSDGNGKLAGIVSERDIVRVLGGKGEGSLGHAVREAMTLKVATCSEDTSIDSVLQTMTEGRFRHLPVVDGETLVGLVSIGDVVKYKIEEAQAEAEQMRDYIAAG